MSTLTELVNKALHRLGQKRIDSLSDTSREAVLAAELWPTVRDAVLRDHNWSIATRRETLAQLDTNNFTPFDYVYALPEEPYCLRLICLLDPENEYQELPAYQEHYIIENRRLYTDWQPVAIKFVARVEDVTDYDPQLVEAMALKLASEMAFSLTQSTEIETKMLQLYVGALAAAQAWDADERSGPYPEYQSLEQVSIRSSGRHQRYYRRYE